MKSTWVKWASALTLLGLLTAGCGGQATTEQSSTTSTKKAEIHVSAAASLTSLMKDVTTVYQGEKPGITVTTNTAGTQVLKTQISQGAPADLLLAARQKDVDELKAQGDVDSVEHLASNHLVIIVSKENVAKIKTIQDLTKKGVRIVLGDVSSPIGEYSHDMVKKLDQSGKFGAHFGDQVLANVVSNESNEQNVLTKVTLGEADAGVVYESSYQDEGKAKGLGAIEVDPAYNVSSDYFLVVLHGASAEGKELAQWLKSDKGHELLKKHGYQL